MKTIPLLLLILCFQGLISQTYTWDSVLAPSGYYPYYSYGFGDKDSQKNLYRRESNNSFNKLDPFGGTVWQATLPVNAAITSLVILEDSLLFVAGNFTGTLTTGNYTIPSAGQEDIFLAKFDAQTGSLQWLRTAGGKARDQVGEICRHRSGLAMTGFLSDTASFFGQVVPKVSNEDLFVATIDRIGTLQNIKLAIPTNTQSSSPTSRGIECTADTAGNIFVYGYGYMYSRIDTSHIGTSYYGDWSILLKFDAQLDLVFDKNIGYCVYACEWYHDFNAMRSGECVYVESYHYGASGNDDWWSRIYKVDPLGVNTSSYTMHLSKPHMVVDIDLDSCDHIYFTGWQRDFYIYSQVQTWYAPVGQLSPALTLQWMKSDPLPSSACGGFVAARGFNDCFIMGVFDDTLTLHSQMVDTSLYKATGFMAIIQGPAVSSPQLVAPANFKACAGNTVNLQATANSLIHWYDSPGALNAVGTGTSYNFTSNQPGTFTLYLATKSCGMSGQRLPVTLTVSAIPSITVAGGSICPSSTFAIVPSGASSYTLSSGYHIVSPLATTVYSVHGTSAEGCTASAVCQVSVVPVQQPTILTSVNFMCPGQTVTLSCNGAQNYTWNTGQQSQPIVVSPTVHTNYSVTSIDANGCTSKGSITQFVADCVGIPAEAGNSFRLYPNPNKGVFFLDLPTPVTITIVNVVGSIVYEHELPAGNNRIDLSWVPKGIYFVSSASTKSVTKVIVE